MNSPTKLPKTASAQEMQRNYRQLLDTVKSTGDPLFLLRNNTPEAVIIDVRSWNDLMDELEVLEHKETVKAVTAFETERKQKKLKTLKGSLADLI